MNLLVGAVQNHPVAVVCAVVASVFLLLYVAADVFVGIVARMTDRDDRHGDW